jgi:uncharacterized membrane protein
MRALIALFLGILSPLTFAAGGLTVRVASEWYEYNTLDLTLTSYFVNGTILMIAMFFQYEYGSYSFIFTEHLITALSGLIGSFAVLFLNEAIIIGYVGPVFALTNIQVIIQTILDAIFLQQIPNTIEIFSALLGIIGSCTIAVGPEIYSKFQNHYNIQSKLS